MEIGLHVNMIALGNRARQGKDEIGKRVCNLYNQELGTQGSLETDDPCVWRTVSFAQGLKEELTELFGWDGDKKAKARDYAKDIKPCFAELSLLQYWGTEVRRMSDPLYWVKKFNEKHKSNNLIVTDMRFVNELAYLKYQRNAFTAQIVRYSSNGVRYLADDRPSDHQSEVELDDSRRYDFVLRVRHGERELNRAAVTLSKQYLDYLKNTDALTNQVVI